MRFFIKSYGCQMNSYDSQRIGDLLIAAGHEPSSSLDEANLVILNTCSIREKAEDKIFSDLGRLKIIKEKSSEKFLITVVGCMARLRSAEIVRRVPYVDAILGPGEIHRMADIVEDISGDKKKDVVVSVSAAAADKFSQLSDKFFNRSVSEFLTVQEGCNNFCSYCIVPHTRGREFSRSVSDVVREAKKLVSSGVKEIILLGQNVNSYKGEGRDGKSRNLAFLLFELAAVDGLKRLRYTTSHPKDADAELGRAHRDIEILMPFLHLPVQSGSDEVLRRMKRPYTRAEYLKCVDTMRGYRPDMAFSSDFIVGFPGESDGDFQQTLQLAEEVGYALAYSFKYSPRPNTAAALMKNCVPEEVKSERLRVLQTLLDKQQSEFNQSFAGKHLNVLFVKKGRHKNQLVGRSEYSQAVSVCDNNISIGDVARVKITGMASHSLIGTVEQ
ncbi:MAG: tRNA (N6-isopentenyl adenosine(37)-C2)-methylthiotransferase MiaB [Holosporaceae bacterium]|jgi:tRNA-2-methylthio-N6-dimethylallyladenosine synthase|nr:tRNA (N6-isopentenyl adenosine(37)-C2)-methylthiotransferase MiaB [Holosporaceae bacterium]